MKRIQHCQSAHLPAGGETLEWCRLELSRCLLEGLDTASRGPARVPRRAHHVINYVMSRLLEVDEDML